MPLVQASKKTYKTIKGKISDTVADEIEPYLDWAGVSMDDFLEQAALVVFKHDADWKKKSMYTLRHSAGAEKYRTLKKWLNRIEARKSKKDK